MAKGKGIIKGGFLRLLQTLLYIIPFLCACAILGIFSYFLAFQSDRHRHIPTWEKAVEGLSGAAVVYTLIAIFLTCCLGGVTFFAIIGLILDLLFCGAMIAVAYFCRNGRKSCNNGTLNTPLGTGQASNNVGGNNYASTITTHVKYKTACELNQACFALAIIAGVLFLVTALMQLALMRHHKKEKRYGPGPDNDYTSGSGKKERKWGRKEKEHDAEVAAPVVATGAGAGALATHHHDTRASHETGYTGNTAVGNNSYDKTENINGTNLNTRSDLMHPVGSHGGYYTQPQGTGVNPYGYENGATQYGTANTTGTATNY